MTSWPASGQLSCSCTEPAAMVVPFSCCTSAAPRCPYLGSHKSQVQLRCSCRCPGKQVSRQATIAPQAGGGMVQYCTVL